ncbi:MAG TPA: fasciclin domain-containing protein, partial [Abditibacterium sp.]
MKNKSVCISAALGAAILMAAPRAQADDIGTTAIKAGNFKTLVAAVKAAGLAPTIMGTKKLTVFAPTDAAFAKLPKGTVEMLLKPENKATLTKILTYHVVSGVVPAKAVLAMKSGATVPVLEGEKLYLRKTGGVILDPGMGMKAKVIKTDIKADNGLIHVIDTVLIPPSIQRAMMAKKPAM